MRFECCRRFDAVEDCAEQAEMVATFTVDALRKTANTGLQAYGGFGFAEECDTERKYKETSRYQVAPVSTNLILSYVVEHALELPQSF